MQRLRLFRLITFTLACGAAAALPARADRVVATPALPLVPFCAPPAAGDWLVAQSCLMTGQRQAPRNVIVAAGVTLTLAAGAGLDIDLSTRHLRVRDGARVVIRQGARVF